MFEVGDVVICIKEEDIPAFVGKLWYINYITNNLFYCINEDLHQGIFPFRIDEIVISTPLMRELT